MELSVRERDRMAVLRQVDEGMLAAGTGAARRGVTRRHFRRLMRRFEAEGDGAAVHRLRGRRSNRALAPEVRERVLALAADPLQAGFGPTLLAEHARRRLGVRVSAETVRGWLVAAGVWKRRRKRAKHRSRRPRRAALGELVQWDSSIHPWLEARGPADLVLVSMHDDATSRMQFGRFVKRDTGAENRRAIIACLKRHGRPLAVYADHAGHFGQRRKDGKRTKSVIARGLEALGVELILAGSPQAKGRIERTYGTAQDRLVKEMRVAGVATIEEANRFLEEHWIPFWNEHFAVAPADPLDAHRPLPPDADLEALFADTAARVVGRDFTVRWKNAFWQIGQEEAVAAGVRPGSRIVVERRLSGELRLRHGGRYLAARALGAARPAPPAPAPAPPRPRPKPSKPGPNHPWRRHIREEVERAVARRERRLAATGASSRVAR